MMKTKMNLDIKREWSLTERWIKRLGRRQEVEEESQGLLWMKIMENTQKMILEDR